MKPRRRARPPLPAALAALTVGLAGCAADAERCDPTRVRGLVAAVGCELGGRFGQRDARLRAEVEAREAERLAALDEARRREAEAAGLAAARADLETRLAGADEALAVLERQLAGTTRARARERLALKELQVRAAELRRRADRPAPAGGDRAAVEAEIRELAEEVERRRRAIGEMLDGAAAS